MSGDTSGADDARWSILRCLFAGEADVLPLSVQELALVTGLPKDKVARRTANWVISGQNPVSQAMQAVAIYRRQGMELARRTLELISDELANLNRAGENSTGDARLKAFLGLTKSLQSLEEVINRMEKASANDEHYPCDALEFRRELEKYLEALGDDGNAG